MSKGRLVTWAAPRWWVPLRGWLAAPAGTLAVLAWVLHLRRAFEFDAGSLASFWPLGFGAYVLGLAVQAWTAR